MSNYANDPGLGWHLATGKKIISDGQIPRFDPFLHFNTPRPWVADQWLADVLLYSAYSWSGWYGVYSLCLLLYLSAFYLIPAYTLRKLGRNFTIINLAAFFSISLGLVHFIARPHNFSFLCFSILFNYLYFLISQPVPTDQKIKPWIIFFLFAAWANLHPAFILGFGLLGIFFASQLLDYWKAGSLSRSKISYAVTILLLALSATIFNPNGINLHRSVLALGSNTYFMNLLSEWQPIILDSVEGRIFLAVIIIFLAAVYLAKNFSLRRSLFTLGSLSFFGCLPFDAIRFLPFFSLLVFVPLAEALDDTFKRLLPSISLRYSVDRYWQIGCLTAVLCLALPPPIHPLKFLLAREPGPHSLAFPQAALSNIIELAKLENRQLHVLNQPDWGGTITWFGQGHLQAYIDDRNMMLGEDFSRTVVDQIYSPSDKIIAYLRDAQLDVVLLQSDLPLSTYLLEKYPESCNYKDSVALVCDLRRYYAPSGTDSLAEGS